MIDIINANTYEDLCDYSIIPEEKKIFTPSFLKKNGIIFCKTDYIYLLFRDLQFSKQKYVLITHHSDHPINILRFIARPSCIKKWFAVNVEHIHPDLIPIPLGLYVHKGYWKKFFIKFDLDWFENNVNRLYNNEKEIDKVYCNWSNTNSSRQDILEILDKNKIKYYWETGLPYDSYCENMSHYKFVICPAGHEGAVDTFRMWEAMHFGCIPIIIKTRLSQTCLELPMIQLNNYNKLTYDLMYSYLNKEYNMEKLYLTYWKNKILDEFKKL